LEGGKVESEDAQCLCEEEQQEEEQQEEQQEEL